jgi:hypothetical protein
VVVMTLQLGKLARLQIHSLSKAPQRNHQGTLSFSTISSILSSF